MRERLRSISERFVIILILGVALAFGLLILFNIITNKLAFIPYFVGLGVSIFLTIYYGRDASQAREVIFNGNEKLLSALLNGKSRLDPVHGRNNDIEQLKNMIENATSYIHIWRGDFSAIWEIRTSLQKAVERGVKAIRVIMDVDYHSFENATAINELAKKSGGRLQVRHLRSRIRGEIYDKKVVRLINKVGKETNSNTSNGMIGGDKDYWYNYYTVKDHREVRKVGRLWNYCWKHSDPNIEALIMRMQSETGE